MRACVGGGSTPGEVLLVSAFVCVALCVFLIRPCMIELKRNGHKGTTQANIAPNNVTVIAIITNDSVLAIILAISNITCSFIYVSP